MTNEEQITAAALIAESAVEALKEAGLPHSVVLVLCSSHADTPASLSCAMTREFNSVGQHMFKAMDYELANIVGRPLLTALSGMDPNLN